MKLNLDKQIVDLAGKPIANDTPNMAKILANQLCQSTSGPAVKFYEFSQKFFNTGEVEIDSTDLKTITDFVEANQQLTNLTKAQILMEIQKAKDAAAAPVKAS